MNLLLMADGAVGMEVYRFLASRHRQDLAMLVTIAHNELSECATLDGINTVVYSDGPEFFQQLQARVHSGRFDLGISSWWPKILPRSIVDLPRHGFINFHPSLLPYNRGKHYNFWALVEQCPYGVSLHFIGQGIDDGDIVMQRELPYDWTDTGETLYHKAQREIVDMFKEGYSSLRAGQIKRIPQDRHGGSFHFADELDPASKINLDDNYRARDLLNLLRARTFPGHPSCYFLDSGQKYEIRVSIVKAEP